MSIHMPTAQETEEYEYAESRRRRVLRERPFLCVIHWGAWHGFRHGSVWLRGRCLWAW